MTDPAPTAAPVRVRVYTWRVEGVAPMEKYGRHQNWNVNLQVIAPTMEQAIAAVREKYPEFRFVKVITDRYIDDVVIARTGEADVPDLCFALTQDSGSFCGQTLPCSEHSDGRADG